MGAIRSFSREKLDQELGLESLKSRRWYRKLCLFFKLKKINIPPTSLIWFPKSYQHGLPETITTSLYLMLNMNTSETQIKETLFEKISNIKRSLLNQNDSIIVETLHFGSNGLNGEENACIIESTIKYIITTERFITPLLWIHLSKSPLFLKSLIDSGSPYDILFSCLVVQFYIYVYIFLTPCWTFMIKVTVHIIYFSEYFSFFYYVYHIEKKYVKVIIRIFFLKMSIFWANLLSKILNNPSKSAPNQNFPFSSQT